MFFRVSNIRLIFKIIKNTTLKQQQTFKRETETDRQTDRQTETERQTDRQTETETERQRERERERETPEIIH